MKLFCVVPTAMLPSGGAAAWPVPHPADWTPCPGDPSKTIGVIDFGNDYGAEAAWKATAGVVVLPEVFMWGTTTVPLAAVALFGPWGVLATDTMAQAAQKIRAAWPHFDPH